MPTVPMVRQDDWNGVQLPTVMSADAAQLARGAQSLARGVADMGRAFAAVGDVVGRVRDADVSARREPTDDAIHLLAVLLAVVRVLRFEGLAPRVGDEGHV